MSRRVDYLNIDLHNSQIDVNNQLILVDTHRSELLGFFSMHDLCEYSGAMQEQSDNYHELSLNNHLFYSQENHLLGCNFPFCSSGCTALFPFLCCLQAAWLATWGNLDPNNLDEKRSLLTPPTGYQVYSSELASRCDSRVDHAFSTSARGSYSKSHL